jgi:histidine triad (HIT) family protein
MATTYDPQNIFARILRGEIPNKTVLNSEHTLAFADIKPQAPVHVLVIPKGAYADYAQFVALAHKDEIIDFSRAVAAVVKEFGLADAGYRLISNTGAHGGQEVPHYHVHVLGGRDLGRMLAQ